MLALQDRRPLSLSKSTSTTRCRNTLLQVKVLHSKSYFSTSAKVLALKILLQYQKHKILIMQNGPFQNNTYTITGL